LSDGPHAGILRIVKAFRKAAVLLFWLASLAVAAGDDFDDLRLKWKDLITGGTNYNLSESLVKTRLQGITNNAMNWWNSMDKTGTNTWLWSDLTSTTVSAQIVTAYSRLQAMALAYATYGSSLRSNTALAADIQKGLDWMYANRYNESTAQYDNWFHWEIGAPLQIVNISVLMYEGLGLPGLQNSLNALDHFTPSPTSNGRAGTFTGANLADRIRAVGVRGAVVKDAAKLNAAREAFSRLFPYVTTGDGYYVDGSFVQHTALAYTGGYGYVLLGDLAILLPWLSGSPWEPTDPARTNVVQWVYDSYEPLIYKGAMMDLTRQRGVSRSGSPDHAIGHNIMQSILYLSAFGSPADQLRMKRMVKYWALVDTSRNFTNNATLPMISAINQLMRIPL
jgi:hyaluronate lyase